MLAFTIFLVTLILVIWQPRGLGIGYSALAGALAALSFGIVQLSDIGFVWSIVWDATFTFIALIIISLILDRAGFFNWAALHIAHLGNGRGHWLFILLVLLGAVISALFANDGAALLLTPIVIAILLRLKFSIEATFAFIIATGFIADTASLPFVISNLVNIVSANYFNQTFNQYALVMLPVYFASVISTLFILWIVFGRSIPLSYDVKVLEKPTTAILDKQVFYLAFPLLLTLLISYFLLASWQVPFSLIAGIIATIFILVASRIGQKDNPIIPLTKVMNSAPWQIVLFSLGMYLVVYGLGQAGLTSYSVAILEKLVQQGNVIATLGTGFLAAITASVVNNMPSTLIGVLAIEQVQASGLTKDLMIYANVIGNDLGPKLTPIGSLATLLWLHVLADKGYKVTWGKYIKIGLIITPPILLASLFTLIGWLYLLNYLTYY